MVTIKVADNLLLRSYRPEDAAALFETISSSRSHLHPWLDWVDKTTKQEHSAQFIQHTIHQANMQEALDLAIVCNDKIAGGIGMHHWDLVTRRAQIGYWITKDHEGKGIITKCLTKFIDFLFNKTGLNKIEIHCVPGNTRSARTAARLGFKTEGVIRQSIIRNGLPEDIVVMGLLQGEWKPQTPKEA